MSEKKEFNAVEFFKLPLKSGNIQDLLKELGIWFYLLYLKAIFHIKIPTYYVL